MSLDALWLLTHERTAAVLAVVAVAFGVWVWGRRGRA